MRSIKRFSTLTLLVVSFWLMAAHPGDVMTELGIETPRLRQDVLLNLKESKWFFFSATVPMRQMAHRLPEAARVTTVQSLGKVVRAYVESSAFRQVWLQDIRTYYPYDEAYTDEKLAQQKQAHEVEKSAVVSQLAAMDHAFAQMEPAMLKMAAQAQIIQEEQQLAAVTGNERTTQAHYVATLKKMLSLPPDEFKKQYLISLKQKMQSNAYRSTAEPKLSTEYLAQQRRQKADFDAHADFRPLLKKRLQDFISLSETVDFEARLVPMGRKQVFANPVYEHKPAEWKFLYRLGKVPVAEAQLVAKQWLVELP